MRKTSVHLSGDDTERLESLAAREGCTPGEVLRKALLYAERGAGRGDRTFAGAGIADGPGVSIADVPAEEVLRASGVTRVLRGF